MFNHFGDGASGVYAQVGVGIRQLASRIQLLQLLAIGGQRAASIGGHPVDDAGERQIEPRHGAVGQHQRAIVGLGECTAAGRDDRMAVGDQLAERLPLELAEVRLALLREDGRNRSPLAGLDSFVDVLHTPPRGPPHRTCHRALASSHEADQIQLVRFHARSDSSTAKNSGYDTAAAPASEIKVGPEAPSAAIAKAMARRWSLRASTSPPRRRRVPRT